MVKKTQTNGRLKLTTTHVLSIVGILVILAGAVLSVGGKGAVLKENCRKITILETTDKDHETRIDDCRESVIELKSDVKYIIQGVDRLLEKEGLPNGDE